MAGPYNNPAVGPINAKKITEPAPPGVDENTLRCLRNYYYDSNVYENVPCISESHALMNQVVLNGIIEHLDYTNIRSFRRVCRRWNDVSDNEFWKSSRIKISFSAFKRGFRPNQNTYLNDDVNRIECENIRLITSFVKTFPSEELLCNEIVFEGPINRAALDYFWKERGSSKLTKIHFRYFQDPTQMGIDINPYLSPIVTTLDISNSFHAKLKVSLDMLVNIQNLYLENCEILLNGKIAPRELALLETNTVSYEGELINCNSYREIKIPIAEFVDFTVLKKLCLRGYVWKLDVGHGVQELEDLEIDSTVVVNLQQSKWTTNCLKIKNYVLNGEKMEIKSISVDHNNVFVLHSLPSSLEHISIPSCGRLLPTPHSFLYDNLKSLVIKTNVRNDLPIFDFTKCVSLTDFYLKVDFDIYQMDYNRIILPDSIKRVKFHNVNATTDVPWKLDTLILDQYTIESAENLLDHIQTDKLVLRLNINDVDHGEDVMSLVNYWKRSRIEQLALGGDLIYFFVSSVQYTEFSQNVETMNHESFLFTKKVVAKGKGIDKDHFERLFSLNLYDHKNNRSPF